MATSPVDDSPPVESAPVGGAHNRLRWTVLVRGTQGSIGQRIRDRLVADGWKVVSEPTPDVGVIVDAIVADYDLLAGLGRSPMVEAAQTVDLAETCAADHLVLISSAMVYGALPNNPIPLTEEAVLRPPPDFAYARQLAAAEELIDDWRRDTPRRTTSVLRVAVPVSERHSSSLARALTAGLGQQQGHAEPPAQFIHLDDVVSAAVLAAEGSLDGVFNVAPDGWISGDRLPALAGNRLRVRLPDRVAEVVSALQWRFQRGPIPPGLRPYLRYSWVVANDKLREQGWRPALSNAEAFVEGTEAPWWATVTPKRRQELALGGLAAIVIGVVVTAVGSLAARRRRR